MFLGWKRNANTGQFLSHLILSEAVELRPTPQSEKAEKSAFVTTGAAASEALFTLPEPMEAPHAQPWHPAPKPPKPEEDTSWGGGRAACVPTVAPTGRQGHGGGLSDHLVKKGALTMLYSPSWGSGDFTPGGI